MSGFIEGESRHQATMFPERLDDYVAEDSAVRVVDVFIDDLDISGLGFKTEPNDTGRPAYHPTTMLKIYIYGYLNRVQSSRRLEREAGRNIELMWLTGRVPRMVMRNQGIQGGLQGGISIPHIKGGQNEHPRPFLHSGGKGREFESPHPDHSFQSLTKPPSPAPISGLPPGRSKCRSGAVDSSTR